MKALLVTEKCLPQGEQRDGGARVVDTLLKAFGSSLTIFQFGSGQKIPESYQFEYPYQGDNRFIRRIKNAPFIGDKIEDVLERYTHLIFIHASMQFSLISHPPKPHQMIWTFPMFLTPSYLAAGEEVPTTYFEWEKTALRYSHKIITPSHLEKKQLMRQYQIPEKKISMIPRGIERESLPHTSRKLNKKLHFCSVGSIKPQKNTLDLLLLFRKLLDLYPLAHLSIVGPIQDQYYGNSVKKALYQLGLDNHVTFFGHIPPANLGKVLKPCHIHLSTTRCETFGRSIFETLSLGIPNVAFSPNNASFEFLHRLPYISYCQTIEEAINRVCTLINNYETLSALSKEIAYFYDDAFLGNLLYAQFKNPETLIISDYDGTLFHKESKEKTRQCLDAFSTYSQKIICTARSPKNVIDQLSNYGILADWVIGLSGAIIADGTGQIHRTVPIENSKELVSSLPLQQIWDDQGEILQFFGPEQQVPFVNGLRREVYEGKAYLQNWKASKLFSIHFLLRKIKWRGNIRVYGDGPYDEEMIQFFDGKTITSDPKSIIEPKEQTYEEILL